ncbi:oxygen-insensitive NAD(P)H nitroreductase [Mangrovibacter yixingensis]|uniref:oxygen-insensitive NAD(P)H nitroreductase n=1 Tax=Mangrovibacter yixingensis TaxID=1529639 RepID=UPI001CF9E558|nr:oxygen-insensitive NAD(P)H nitroreductase [Mangrovibacter yixingensis]
MTIDQIVRKRYTSKAYDGSRKLTQEQQQQLLDVLRFAPSSVNSQPWHFYAITSDEAKQQIIPAVSEPNAAKIKNAAMVVVFATRTAIDDAHLNAVLEQEQQDGRFINNDAREGMDKGRRYFVGLNSTSAEKQREWMARQAYIALGFLLLSAASMGLDATPIEGFTSAKMDDVLGLAEKDQTSVVVATVGYRSDADFNAKLPKSRLGESEVITLL